MPADAQQGATIRKFREIPKVFYVDDTRFLIKCVAEGTDGCLYWVSVQDCGWSSRRRYSEPTEKLRPLPLQVAVAINRIVGGGEGEVRIATT